ncbi:unnamed protein product [Angiostrongylus costaricensis]|uniref:Uncharacterized protein n=1 Tax=Angiostrongylus costaricensis TaxID=334426 RepID=A0A0R3PIM3_ANGCS|nr:unnamed protein product [Angiostrongylus costaricensis]
MSRTEKRNAIPFPMRRNQNSDLGRTRTADLLCRTEKRNAIPFPMRRNQNSDLGRTRTADLLCVRQM